MIEADWLQRAGGAGAGVTTAQDAALDPRTAFPLVQLRETIDRGRKLAARLRPKAGPQRLEPLVAELDKLEGRLARIAAAEAPYEARRAVYLEARWLNRKIAFSNPLLDFDKLVFIKRHRGSLSHMCDQYYGFTAVPGGGLFVLSDPFGGHPKLTNLVEDATVENGRLKGRKLLPGSFLSPEVSYDGKTILFAHSENSQPMRSWDEVFPPATPSRTWTATNCYHIFKVGAGGRGLVQLTDGPWDEFDPCVLPGGRIAFISERRGGFVRCGIRACRSFNLCSMEPDGSDIVLLSYFDTNEWHPSVNHDGMIVYTSTRTPVGSSDHRLQARPAGPSPASSAPGPPSCWTTWAGSTTA